MKNTLIKAFAIIMVIALALSSAPYTGYLGVEANAASDSTELSSGHYYYTVKNKKATITSTDWELSGKVTVPSKLGGYPVVAIGELAFMFNSMITELVIPDSIESIGADAFSQCMLLRTVKIGKGVKKIVGNPFYGCELLSKITVSSSNANYCSDANGVLYSKDKTKLIAFPSALVLPDYKVPEGVKVIGESAFAGNEMISSVTLPSTVNEIQSQAFMFCSSLKTISGPETLYKIGLNAFLDTPWFNAVANSPVYFGKVLCGYNGNTASPFKLEIAEGTLGIAEGALSDITDTKELYIPASLIYIGEGGVVSAGLKKIYVDPLNKKFASDANGVLYSKDMKTLVAYPASAPMSSYTVSDKTEKIGNGAFGAAMYLSEVNLPSSVKTIGDSAFALAMGLQKVKLSKNLTRMGEYAFSFCMSLKSVTIPAGIKKLEDGVFAYCSSLTSVKFGKNLETIDAFAFSGCSALTKLTLDGKIKYVGDEAFSGCVGLKSVTLGRNVKTLSGNPFYGCEGVKKFVVDSKNKYFATDGFGVLLNKKLTKLVSYPLGRTGTTYSVPKTVTSIGAYAFNGADKLKSVSLSEKTKSIGEYAFAECTKLKTMNFIAVRTIGESAFEFCENLKTVYFSKKLTEIEKGAFDGCESLSAVYYQGTKSEWKKVKLSSEDDDLLFDDPIKSAKKTYSHKHTYGNAKATVKSNYVRSGYNTSTCSKCGCIKTADIAKLKLEKVKLTSVKSSAKKQLTVKWNPVTDATGYTVKYSTSKDFTDKTTKTATVENQKTGKITLKKLKSKKKYYVKVRAFKTVSGTTVYGSYSKTLSVKTK